MKTVVLFFEKGAPTRKIWFYQLDPGRNLGKTNPLNDDDLKEFVALQKTFRRLAEVVERRRQDHRPDDLRSLGEEPERGRRSRRTAARRTIMDEIAALDAESCGVCSTIRGLL